MSNNDPVANKVEIIATDINETREIIERHIESLSYPIDSWLEGRLLEAAIHKIIYNSCCVGYAGQIEETLHFFHICKEYFRFAPGILEAFIEKKDVKRVFVMTQDSLLSALIAEWDYEKEKAACWFTDSGRKENTNTQTSHAVFRIACLSDVEKIRKVCGDFFEEPSGGFGTLEERVEAKTIFILEDEADLLGCGIVEKGQLCEGVASIGMFVNREHRRKGAAKTILLNLKVWAYNNNLKPVAGCWYYNTLSRKSLESAGMIATSIGFEAILKGKEKLPLRTGNPPGELVE
ncbi:MAG: hypothetical protein N3B21_05470 [Clostridia bacterium]|nr:hypothetical protein [Clostridia bacterium]